MRWVLTAFEAPFKDNSNVIREIIPGQDQMNNMENKESNMGGEIGVTKKVLNEEKGNNENNTNCITDNKNGVEALKGKER